MVVPERPEAEAEDDGLEQLGSEVAGEDHPHLRGRAQDPQRRRGRRGLGGEHRPVLGTASRTAVRYFGTASAATRPSTTRTAVRTSSGRPPDEDEPLVEDVVAAPLPPGPGTPAPTG